MLEKKCNRSSLPNFIIGALCIAFDILDLFYYSRRVSIISPFSMWQTKHQYIASFIYMKYIYTFVAEI